MSKLFYILFLIGTVASAFLSIFKIHPLLNYFVVAYLILVPGYLLLKIINIKIYELGIKILYSTGLSIFFIYVFGLLLNSTHFLFNIPKPLSFLPILSIYLIIAIIGTIYYVRHLRSESITEIKYNFDLNNLTFVVPILFLILSFLGTNSLNNGGSNVITLFLYFFIIVYVLFLTLRKNTSSDIYPWSIYFISLSILLSFSLRSWHVIGVDSQTEYQMFQITKSAGYWNSSNVNNAYYGVISDTIFPLIMSYLTKINPEYVFKLIIPCIFSFSAVSVYYISRIKFNRFFSFLSSFFFISQPVYVIEFTGLIKQELGLFFFSIILLNLLITSNESNWKKELIFLIFAIPMVLSHYSTTYIAAIFFTLIYISQYIFKIILLENNVGWIPKFKINLKEFYKLKSTFISLKMLIALFLIISVWYFFITNIGSGLISVGQRAESNIERLFSNNNLAQQSSFLQQFNIFFTKVNSVNLLSDYVKTTSNKYSSPQRDIQLYSKTAYGDFNPRVTYPKIIEAKVPAYVIYYISLSIEIIKKLLKLFIFIGVIYSIIKYGLNKTYQEKYMIICALSFLFILLLVSSNNVLFQSFSLFRLYQQELAILSLFTVLGCIVVFRFVTKQFYTLLVAILLLIYFSYSTGFLTQFIGNSAGTVQLNNFGYDYDIQYTHEEDVKGAQWLKSSYSQNYVIYSDLLESLKLRAFADINQINNDILPQTIVKNSYVYMGTNNTLNNEVLFDSRSGFEGYTYPVMFLNINKNLIYNNGGNKIYK